MTDAARRERARVDVLQTMDAQIWATEFMRLFKDRKDDIDHGLMLAWFANAIMRGFDEATRNHDAALRATIEQQAQELERVKSEKNDAVIELYRKLDAKDAELAAMTTEREAACGELMVSLDDAPIGSLAGKLVMANRVLRSQLAASQALAGNSSLMPLVTSLQAQLKGTKDAKEEIQATLAIAEAGVKALNEEVADWRDRVAQLQATLAAREVGYQKTISECIDQIDLQCDEFNRIKSITDNEELKGICDRAVKDIGQRVPVIQQRDAAVQEAARLREELIRLKTPPNSEGAP